MDQCLLFIFAHPDDESFSGAGTAMEYAAEGARIALITATRGEQGKQGDPPICTREELPAVRERELRDAAAIIGFDEVQILDYRDRQLADAAPDDIRATLVSHIRRLRPSIVLTFDPNGFNVHPDHLAISRFVSDAVAAAGDPRWHPETGGAHQVPRLLWTPTIPPWEAGRIERLHEHYGVDLVIDITRWRERKAAALRAHRTQHLSIDRCFFSQPDVERILSLEVWRQAWGPPPRRPARAPRSVTRRPMP
jgi:LmbE family N-acetylglucosaminyl deacetylase